MVSMVLAVWACIGYEGFFLFQYRVTLSSLGLSITIDTIKRHNQVIITFIYIITNLFRRNR